MKFRYLALLIVMLGVSVLPIHYSQFISYGPMRPVGAPLTAENPLPSRVVEVPVSTEHVMQVLQRSVRPEIIKHMVERVDTPLAGPTDIRYAPPIHNIKNVNWAGYAPDMSGTRHTVTAALSNFKVQAVCASCTDVATFVGIGGVHNSVFAQTGVDQKLLKGWYEFYPNPPVYLLNVRGGDNIWTKTSIDPTNGKWLLTVSDQTTGQFFSKEFDYNQSDRSTADFIVEVQGGAVPAFANVTFTEIGWEDERFSVQRLDSSEMAYLNQIVLNDPAGGCVSLGPPASRSFTVYPFRPPTSCP